MRETTPKILLVDDDPDDHFFMQTVIREFNPSITMKSVYNGVQALEHLKQGFRADLILTDLNMPILSGLDLLKELKKNPGLKDIPVFVISTSKNEKVESDCLNHGALKYYLKPISTEDLKHILSEVLLTAGVSL